MKKSKDSKNLGQNLETMKDIQKQFQQNNVKGESETMSVTFKIEYIIVTQQNQKSTLIMLVTYTLFHK